MTHPLPPDARPIVRPAARVVVIDGQGRVLLFLWDDERLDIRRLWITPGGGLRPGEPFEEAARRELWEETGTRADPGPCVWVRRHVFRFGERWIDARERYFVVRVPRVVVRTDHWTAGERRAMVEHRLWPLDDIASAAEVFVPRRLAELLPPLLDGDYPAPPVQIGE